MNAEYNARAALFMLLETRGDFRSGSPLKGASLLALAAVHVTGTEAASVGRVIAPDDRIAILNEAHRNLFSAKG